MRTLLIAVALIAGPAAGSATAQVYPARPITMVVPFAAGGSSDTIGRIIADGMRGPLGQSVIIENVGGASGNIGVGRVARAAPDGYTLILGSWPTHVLECRHFRAAIRPRERFRAGVIGRGPTAARDRQEGPPPKNLVELIAWLKASPYTATQATAGAGGASHVAGVFFQRATGTRFQFVPYRAAAPGCKICWRDRST
jgi:tripartite-type tricarboxylate transporter receptor subunit TctC